MRCPLAILLALGLLGCEADAPVDDGTPVVDDANGVRHPIRLEPRRDGIGLAGITLTSGVDPSTTIIEVKGGGLGLVDGDGDGDLDLLLPNGATLDRPFAGPGAVYLRNLAVEEGRLAFVDATEGSGFEDHRDWSFGVAVGDVDGDGVDDVIVATLGPDRVWLGRGDGTFEDATDAWGLADATGWTSSVGLGDLDEDGDLDLVSVGYLEFDPSDPPGTSLFRGIEVLSGPRGMSPRADRWYENVGDRFEARDVPGEDRFGLNLVIVDFDGDGREDVLVGNDSQPNQLHRNLGDWRFEDIGLRVGAATNREGDAQATMGMAVGDVDGDGTPDVFTTNFSSDTNTLHVNRSGYFDDLTRPFGLAEGSRQMLGWATEFVDLDHDGDEDLVVFNGHVYPQATLESMDSPYAQAPGLWRRGPDGFEFIDPTGDRHRREAGRNPWLSRPAHDRSAVFADLDLDGDVDVAVAERNGPVRVLENLHDGEGDWIVVRPEPATGARIELRDGDDVQARWIRGGGPFQSNAAPEAHFGLGRSSGGPVRIEVRWPDGTRRVLEVMPGRRVRVERDAIRPGDSEDR